MILVCHMPSEAPTRSVPVVLSVAAALLVCASLAATAATRTPGGGDQAPASQTAAAQSYSPEQVDAGQKIFAAQCGFCHGRDAMGGESGPDLTESALVSQDVRGDKLGPMIRAGRTDKGMPAFTLSDFELIATVAYIHDQKRKSELPGRRRTVDLADLQTGSAEAGKRYFDSACTKCHSAAGDLAGIAARLKGLALLQTMLYPGTGRDAKPPAPPKVTVTLASGQKVSGVVAYRDEFTIALTDAEGWYRSWPTRQVKFIVDDPLEAHVEQLGKYTDRDMHDVLAYLQTLQRK